MSNQAQTKKVVQMDGRHKATSSGRKRDFRVSPKGKRRAIQEPKRELVKQAYFKGKNLSEIAKEQHIHRTTVAKIVKEEDVAAHIKDLREKFYGRLAEAVEEAFNYIHKNEEGGKQAYQMMKDAGIVRAPQEIEIVAPVEPETEQKAIERIALAMLKGTVEKHKFFDMPLPDAEEIEEALKKEGNDV
jgi:hypothetical protein